MDADPFILFCLPRTGSTTLYHALHALPGVDCLNEPFNPDCHPGYAERVVDEASLAAALRAIWARHDGIKHVAGPGEWPFGRAGLNDRLLAADGARVLFLTRRNLLQQALSTELARQTGVWHPWTEGRRERFRTYAFAPVSPHDLARRIAEQRDLAARCRRVLAGRRGAYRELTYEDLFGTGPLAPGGPLDEIAGFLGHPPATGADRERIAAILGEGRTRSASATVYDRVPNIAEIERALGGGANGSLFPTESDAVT